MIATREQLPVIQQGGALPANPHLVLCKLTLRPACCQRLCTAPAGTRREPPENKRFTVENYK